LFGLSFVATAAEEPALTSLLGTDVGLCVELRDLRTHVREVPTVEWFRRLRELTLVKRWQQGPEFAKLQAGQATLAVLVGQPLEQFVTELCGESVVLAVTPAKAGPPGVVLLSRSAKDDTWDRVLALWDQLEAHEVQTKSAFGRSFQRRQKKVDGRTSGADVFTVKLGRILAISEREELIRDVVTRFLAAEDRSEAETLGQSASYRQASAALPNPCAIRAFLRTSSWETELQRDPSSAAWLLPLCRKIEWISAGVEFRDGIIGHLVVRHQTSDLPAVWQKFVAGSAAAPHSLAARLPANAVLAGEARIDPSLWSWLRTLDESDRARNDWETFGKVTRGLLGRDLFEEVLPHAGPSLGGAILPKRPVEEQSAPVDGLFAWQLNSSNAAAARTAGQPGLRESLDGALLTLLNFAAVAHNSRNPDVPATLRIESRDDRTIKWLDRLPPYQPAFSVGAEDILLATDPQLIRQFPNRSANGEALTSDPLFAALHSRHLAEHSHWLFVNSRAAREFVAEQHEPLSRQIAHWRKLAPPSVAAQLERVREILSPFDAMFLGAKVTTGEVRLTAGAVTLDPRN
jgi:hypothetical protein